VANTQRGIEITFKVRDYALPVLQKIQRFMRGLGSAITAPFRGVFSILTSVRGAITGFYTFLAAKAGAQAFTGLLEDAGSLQRFAKSLGTTVEELSELRGAFILADVPAQEFEGILRSLQQTTAKLLSGQGKGNLAAVFRDLGISLEDLGRLSPGQLFERIATSLGKFSSAQDKALILSRLFPEQFEKLVPLLGDGQQAFAGFVAEARKFGATISGGEAAAAGSFSDALKKLKLSVEDVGLALATAFGERAAGFVERLGQLIVANKDTIVAAAQRIGDAIVQALFAAGRGLADLVTNIDLTLDLVGRGSVDRQRTLAAELQAIGKQMQALPFLGAGVADPAFERLKQQQEGLQNEMRALQAGAGAGLREAVDKMAQEYEATRRALQALQGQGAAQGLAPILPGPGNPAFAGTGGGGVAAARPAVLDTGAAEQAAKIMELRRAIAAALPDYEAFRQVSRDLEKVEWADRLQQAVDDLGIPADEARAAFVAISAQMDKTFGEQREQQLRALQQSIAALMPDTLAFRQANADIEKAEWAQRIADALDAGLIPSLEEARRLLDLINGQIQQQQSLFGSPDFFDGFTTGLHDAIRGFTDLQKFGTQAANEIVSQGLNGLTDALTDAVLGIGSTEQAFKQLAATMIRALVQIAIQMAIIMALKLAFAVPTGGASLLLAEGGVTNRRVSRVRKFADGGVATRPTMAIFGERGSEAFVPLKGGKIPVDLGDAAGPGGGLVVNFNLMMPDGQSGARFLQNNADTIARLVHEALQQKNSLSHLREVG